MIIRIYKVFIYTKKEPILTTQNFGLAYGLAKKINGYYTINRLLK